MHRPGKDNPADLLSRKPLKSDIDQEIEHQSVEMYVNHVFEQSIPRSVSQGDIIKATNDDAIFQELIQRIRGLKVNNKHRMSKHFDNIFHEMSVTAHGVVMRNNLIVIPESLINRIIDIGHEGHQGITKTKSLIRTKVWFPKWMS